MRMVGLLFRAVFPFRARGRIIYVIGRSSASVIIKSSDRTARESDGASPSRYRDRNFTLAVSRSSEIYATANVCNNYAILSKFQAAFYRELAASRLRERVDVLVTQSRFTSIYCKD